MRSVMVSLGSIQNLAVLAGHGLTKPRLFPDGGFWLICFGLRREGEDFSAGEAACGCPQPIPLNLAQKGSLPWAVVKSSPAPS
jgi:hypothetical protein